MTQKIYFFILPLPLNFSNSLSDIHDTKDKIGYIAALWSWMTKEGII